MPPLTRSVVCHSMKNYDLSISIDEGVDRKRFFAELLTFYAKQDVVLTLWGKLPKNIYANIKQFKAPCSLIRRWLFKQSEWYLHSNSLNQLVHQLCDDDLLENLTWGLVKTKIPLGHSLSWDDMNINGSEFIDEQELFCWLEHLIKVEVIQSYEKITD